MIPQARLSEGHLWTAKAAQCLATKKPSLLRPANGEQILQFESEHSKRQSHISHATHYRLTDYEYYETVRNSHISIVTTEYKERYRKWLETKR